MPITAAASRIQKRPSNMASAAAERFPRKTAPPRDWPRSANGSASRARRREMAAAYDHRDHNAPAIRHCDVIAYRSFVSRSVRENSSRCVPRRTSPATAYASTGKLIIAVCRANACRSTPPVAKRSRARLYRSKRHASRRRRCGGTRSPILFLFSRGLIP